MTIRSAIADMSVNLDMSSGIMAVGRAGVRYHGTDNWLYIGHDEFVDVDGNQIGRVYCSSLGYGDGHVGMMTTGI